MISAGRLALAGCVGLALALSDLQAQSPTAVDPLIGIWASETTFGPALHGELTVAREGSIWRATLLIDADPAVRRPALIHSVLVARGGKLVLEEYFFGFDRDQPHDMRSAGKTFVSVMLGAAMMQGAHLAPETPVYGLLAGMGPFANPDPRKSQITVAHLMTHTSGLACDDNDQASRENEDTM